MHESSWREHRTHPWSPAAEDSAVLILRLLGDRFPGIYYWAEQEEGDLSEEDLREAYDEVSCLHREAGLGGRPVISDFEIGRGAQGDPLAYVYIADAVLFGTAAFGAAIVQIDKAIPVVRKWIRFLRQVADRLGGSWNLEAAKLAAFERVGATVPPGTEIVWDLVTGSRASLLSELNDTELAGPYYVTIPVPATRTTYFVTVTEAGEVAAIVPSRRYDGPDPDGILEEPPV